MLRYQPANRVSSGADPAGAGAQLAERGLPMTNDASVEEDLTAFFSADPDAISWPYPLYERIRQGAGAARWAGGPGLVPTRYHDVKTGMSGAVPLANNAYLYGALASATLARIPAPLREPLLGLLDFEGLFMSRKDGAEHLRLRRIASKAFTARRIAQLTESISLHVNELLTPIVRTAMETSRQIWPTC